MTDYRALMDESETGDADRIRQSLAVGTGRNPDEEAKLQELSKLSGVAVEALRYTAPEVEKRVAIDRVDYRALMSDTPVLGEFLTKPENASIVHDDIDNLGGFERVTRGLQGILGPLRMQIGGTMLGAGEFGTEVAAPVLDYMRRSIAGASGPGGRMTAMYSPALSLEGAETLASEGKILAQRGREEYAAARPENFVGGLGYDIASSIPPILTGIATGIPTAAIGVLTTLFTGGYYEEGRTEKGLTPGEAAVRAIVLGSAEGLTEAPVLALLRTPVKALATSKTLPEAVRAFLGSKTGKIMGLAGVEGVQEGLTQGIQEAYDAGVLGEETTLWEATKRIGYSMLVGAGAGATLGVPAVLSDKSADEVMRRQVDRNKAGNAGPVLSATDSAADATKLRERSPDKFEEFTEAQLKAVGKDTVYMPFDAFQTYYQSKELDPADAWEAMTGERDGYLEAQVSGSDLQIPYARYLARVAPEDRAELTKHIKLEPDSLSAAELESEDINKQITELMESQEQPEKPADDELFTRVRDELVATGRYDEASASKVARLTQQRYQQRAQQRGKAETAMQAYETDRLEFAKDGVVGGDVVATMEQASTQTDTPEFTRWFGDSKVVNSSGEPLRVYHGTASDFVEFAHSNRRPDLGFHFGNEEQANGFATESGARVLPVYLKIVNPLRMRDVFGRGSKATNSVAWELRRLRLIDEDTYRKLAAKRPLKDAMAEARKIIEGAGYDGVVYENVFEGLRQLGADEQIALTAVENEHYGKGSDVRYLANIPSGAMVGLGATQEAAIADGLNYLRSNPSMPSDSYIAFRPEQIKSAVGNRGTFDPTNPNILMQQGRARIEFNTAGGARIVLTPESDFSSVLHELGHKWFDELITDATTEGTSPQLRTDLDTLLKHFGLDVRSENGAEAIRNAVERKHHELFATSFEAYLRDGKAPSSELREAFRSFKRWLLAIYQEIQQLVRLGYTQPLNSDVRAVFDRLLATDEQIEAARSEQSIEPMLPVAEMRKLGVSEAKLKKYADALERAKEKLGAKVLADLIRKSKRPYRQALKQAAREVSAETVTDKAYIAIEILRNGKSLDGTELPQGLVGLELNKADLTERYGDEAVKKLKGMFLVDGGESADTVAMKLGYASGDLLVKALTRPSRKDYIKAEARRRAEDQYPDSMVDGTMPERAMAALHNNRLGQAIQSELELLGELAKQGVPDIRVIKETAKRIIGKKTVRQNIPGRYLIAERKASREAAKAAAAGKYAEALVSKRRQALNAALYSEANRVAELVERTDTMIGKLRKKGVRERLASGGQEYLVAVEQIAHVYGYRPLSESRVMDWQSLAGFIDALDESMEVTAVSEAVVRAVEGKAVRNSRDISVTEFIELHDAYKNLTHLAGLANKVKRGNELVAREVAITALTDAATKSGLTITPLPENERELSYWDRIKRGFKAGEVDITRPENLYEALDGGQSGAWHDFIFSRIEKSENTKSELQRLIGLKLKALRKRSPSDLFDKLDQGVTFLDGVTKKRVTLMAIVLNTGNAGNKQRVIDGGVVLNGKTYELTDADIQSLRAKLTDDELAYVQGIWDAVNSLWPDIVRLQKQMSGVPPERVLPESFTVRGKTYNGGYWPLVYNHNLTEFEDRQSDEDAMRAMLGIGVSRAFTPKGHTKARAKTVKAPLKLDFGSVLSRHLDQVMTDIAYRETVKHVSALLKNQKIKQAILERFGRAGYDSIRGQLAYSVSASSTISGQSARSWQSLLDGTLSNLTIAALSIRPDIALGNVAAGYIQGLDRSGLKGLMRGLYNTYFDRGDMTEMMKAKSTAMKSELEEWDHAYSKELLWTQGRTGFGPAYRRVMMSLHRLAQHEVSRAIWSGIYLNEKGKGTTDEEAVRLADKAIRTTQMTKGKKDMSTFERDPGFRQTRQYMGPMFVLFGRMVEIARGRGNRQDIGRRLVGLMLFLAAPAIFALAAGRWPKDADDDDEFSADEWAIWLAANTLLFPFQTIPILRDIGSAIESAITGNRVNPRTAPTAKAIQDLYYASSSIVDNIEQYQDSGEMDYTDITRDLVTIGGVAAGLPASQYRITSKAVDSIMEGTDEGIVKLMIYGPERPK